MCTTLLALLLLLVKQKKNNNNIIIIRSNNGQQHCGAGRDAFLNSWAGQPIFPPHTTQEVEGAVAGIYFPIIGAKASNRS